MSGKNAKNNAIYAAKKTRYKKKYRYSSLFLWALLDIIAVGLIVAYLYGINPMTNTLDQPPVININSALGTLDTNENNNSIEIDETEWNLVLVNKWNYIPDNYEVELTELANGQFVDKRIYPALQEMFDAARSDAVYPIVASGYRTTEKQLSLLEAKITEYMNEGYSEQEAKNKAEVWVAVPGTSEHQLGLGIDINADGIHSTGNEVYEWLRQNSYKFGFIRRYPEDKTEITGIINEPWHYRYVGVDAATEIYKEGICLEEYLNK